MQPSGARSYVFYSCLSIGILAVTAYLMWAEFHLAVSVSALLGLNAAGLVCMGIDKSLARSEALRIPEVVLYLIALVGGVPGLLVGVHVFKHKTRKAAFQFVLLVIVVVQLVVMRFLVGTEG